MGQKSGTMNKRRLAIATLGCKVNQYDTELIREEMGRLGFEEVPFSQTADVYIVNTCTVTGRSDYQSRQLMRRAHRLNPKAVVVATGCYADVFPHVVGEVEGVSAVLGNQAKREVAFLVSHLMAGGKPFVRVPPVGDGPLGDRPIEKFSHHCRAFLKIQDGCNAACTYCIVPRARGRSRSLLPTEVLERLTRLKTKGYQEVVLTGVHLGSYGLDLSPPTSLAGLIRLAEKTPDLPPRLRLSSVEPTDFDQSLLVAIESSSRICPHLHIPLQSGDDLILSRMGRGYTREAFESLIDAIRGKVPTVCIGLDVIGGFPGEEEAHFRNTIDLIEGLPVAYLHVFPFSPRPGTAAFDLPQRARGDVIRRRCMILRELGQKKREAFYRRFLYRKVRVLEERTTTDSDGRCKGVSRNYIPVWTEPDGSHVSGEIEVEITEVKGQKVLGRRV
jgi:threonylcarbamoyladenosine tRNA methylthiotransferase MtaB